MKRYSAKIICMALMIIFFAMLIQSYILAQINRRNAYRVTHVLLDQIVKIIDNNSRDAADLYASVKEDYKIRAQSVSYILDSRPEAIDDKFELDKIAALLFIDEINIFDKTGKIIAGTVPGYFGLTFDSGKQMSYFKPMLRNKRMQMCQDLTPNTYDGRMMMYAITWNEAGDQMVQIGIEPERLLESMERTKITTIIDELPVYDGAKTFVADATTGKIIDCKPKLENWNHISDIGLSVENFTEPYSVLDKSLIIDGLRNYSSFCKVDNLIVCVTYYIGTNQSTYLVTMLVIFVYMSIAAIFVVIMFIGRMKNNEVKLAQFAILSNMSKIYYSMHLINLRTNSVTEYSTQKQIKAILNKYQNADEMMRAVMREGSSADFKDAMVEFGDLNTIADRMTGKRTIAKDFIGVSKKWFRASFIMIECDKDEKPTKVIFTIQDINEDKQKELILVHKSTTDEFTDCFNRRAFEEDLKELDLDSEFTYMEFDLNALKPVNDTIGHDAGDELIKAAGKYMKEVFSSCGSVYRTGGDEFVVIVKADSKKVNKLTAAFDKKVIAWKGKLVDSMSVSYGSVSSKEQKWNSILAIAKEADKRMYQNKNLYYQKSRLERRASQKR